MSMLDEYKALQADKKSTVSTGSGQKKSILEEHIANNGTSGLNEKYVKYATAAERTDVDAFTRSVNSYVNSYNSYVSKWRSYDDENFSGLNATRGNLLSYASDYRNRYSGDKEAQKYFDDVISMLKSTNPSSVRKMYSDFGSEEEYNNAVKRSEEYQAAVSRPAAEYQADIDRLTIDRKKLSGDYKAALALLTATQRGPHTQDEIKSLQESVNKYKADLSDMDQQREQLKAGKWKAENYQKYANLSSNADFAEKSRIIDKSKGTTIGITIGDNYYGIGDEVYAYINNIGNRKELAKQPDSGAASMQKYDFMTQAEKDNYNYLYQTEGKKSANDYLEYLSYDLDARRTQKYSGQWAEFADQHPIISSAMSVPTNLISGIGLVDVAAQNIARNISGEYKPINYNSSAMNATNATTAIRGTIAQNLADEFGTINLSEEEHPILARFLNGKSLGDVYQLGMSMVDSSATAGIGAATGIGAFGTILLGGSAGSQGVLTAIEKGATDEQALAMGIRPCSIPLRISA